MPYCPAEPTLTDALADGIVQAMMKADGVDRAGLEALLGGIARRRELGHGAAIGAGADRRTGSCRRLPPAEHRAGS